MTYNNETYHVITVNYGAIGNLLDAKRYNIAIIWHDLDIVADEGRTK